MKTLSITKINNLKKLSTQEILNSYMEYDKVNKRQLETLVNTSTIDKSVYVGLLIAHGMKAVEISQKTGLSKSNLSRMSKVGKWILENPKDYAKLVASASDNISFRTLCDSITHKTINGNSGDWDSLVKAEAEYKREYNATKSEKVKASKPSTDGKKIAHMFTIEDFEKMNNTALYSEIITLVDGFKADNTQAETLINDFIKTLKTLKH